MWKSRFILHGLIAAVMAGLVLQSSAAAQRLLESAASSPDELARRFLDALAGNKPDEVRKLALSEEEFRKYVWPELPSAEPARNLTPEFVWNSLHIRSESNLRSMMASVGGHRLRLEEVRFTGGVTEYKTYRVHRASLLFLKDEVGKDQTVRLFGSVLELDGQFKIFSFNR
jgi:hypothetical protein